jgi:cell shape-determining protein MreC
MFPFRIKHLAGALMTLCLLCALAVPPSAVARLDAGVAVLFEPVSLPSRVIASRLLGRGKSAVPLDTRPDADLRAENDDLRQQVAYLNDQLDAFRQINKDRDSIGKLRAYCTPAEVIAGDSGLRDTLVVDAGSATLRINQPVIYAGGLAGRVESAGPASSRVRLVTDKGVSIQTNVVRYIRGDDGKSVPAQIKIPDPMLEGAGNGLMTMRITRQDAAGLLKGDWIILHDPDWPTIIAGTRIGTIAAIAPSRDAALFVDITVVPTTPLDHLREVQVLTRE